MGKEKIAITLDGKYVQELDRLVRERSYKSRSQVIQEALNEKLARIKRMRLAEECAKADPVVERAMSEESLGEDAKAWPEY
jgi:metal-responsive CopG/Arc/MetJ family transcriptional regulator